MKILILNQPTSNRGDEAAHRSLVRGLNRLFPEAKVTVFFTQVIQDNVNQMMVDSSQNKYVNVCSSIRGSSFAERWGLRLGLRTLASLHPAHRLLVKYIRDADVVVCAPGGICMGLFQSWGHIYNLDLALLCHKKVAYYSRSFGPFPIETQWNRIFKKISYHLLNRFDFISIRDAKTMQLADKIGLSYIPSIDTAFLDTPRVELPDDLKKIIGNKEYVVFVPNTLRWHPAFKNCPESYLEDFYLHIMNLLLKKYQNADILMLPQLFNVGKKGDMEYFLRLKKLASNNRIKVISDQYSSDIQQTIISNAKLMIGARYHSVVFAINNEVPFVALSYEHKVSGLLQILGLQEYIFDIEHLGENQPDISSAINEIEEIMQRTKVNKLAKKKAQDIAKECMNQFVGRYRNL